MDDSPRAAAVRPEGGGSFSPAAPCAAARCGARSDLPAGPRASSEPQLAMEHAGQAQEGTEGAPWKCAARYRRRVTVATASLPHYQLALALSVVSQSSCQEPTCPIPGHLACDQGGAGQPAGGVHWPVCDALHFLLPDSRSFPPVARRCIH